MSNNQDLRKFHCVEMECLMKDLNLNFEINENIRAGSLFPYGDDKRHKKTNIERNRN